MRFIMLALVPATVVLSAPAYSQETGLAGIHSQARVGGKTCMTEHEHYGEGTMSSRKGAEQAAMRSWASFTAWEYGAPWGRYNMAVGKSMGCTQSGGQWVCKTTARPCRPGG